LHIDQQLEIRQLNEQHEIWVHSWGMSGQEDADVYSHS
jgi:hypothetical protein